MDQPNYSEPVKNKSGYYEIRWSEYDDKAGRSRSRCQSCGTKNRAEAVAFRGNFVRARAAIDEAQTGWTIGRVCDAYLDGHARPNCESRAQEWALTVLRRWFENHDVADVTEDEVEAYTNHRRKTVKDGTIRKELSALRTALNWCASPRRKPAMLEGTSLPYIELPPDGAARTNFLSAEEAARMFELARVRATGNEMPSRRRIGLFLCLALETAARQGAIRGLTWDRVDFTAGIIDFRDPTKKETKKRRVPVPISAALRPVLEDAYARRDPQVGYVLGHAGSVRNPFLKFCDDHGFDCTVHDLRRTWATLRVMWGAPLDKVAAILGDTLEVTTRHYAHLQPGYGRDVMDLGPGTPIAAE